MKRPFRMITSKQILSQICPGDWFFSLDLKDTYFHIQIAPHHRRFLRFAFEGVAYHGCSSFPAETDRNPHPELPRRLAHFGPVGGRDSISQFHAPQPLRVPRTQGQFWQERTVPQPTNFLPGNSYPAAPSVLAETSSHGCLCVKMNQACVAALAPWENHLWIERGVPLGMVYRRKVVSTDASNLGWGVLSDNKPAFGFWSKKEVHLHINCLQMLTVSLGLCIFLSDLRGYHVLVCSGSMTVVSYLNPQGGLSSRLLFILAKCLFRWAQLNLRSLRATPVPGKLNLGADMLFQSNVPSDEWTLHPQTVLEIWEIFSRPEVDVFDSENNTHFQTYFSKDRDALAHNWPYLLLFAFPPIALILQVIRRIRE